MSAAVLSLMRRFCHVPLRTALTVEAEIPESTEIVNRGLFLAVVFHGRSLIFSYPPSPLDESPH